MILKVTLHSFLEGLQQGWAPVTHSGNQLSDAPLEWLSFLHIPIILVSPLHFGSVGPHPKVSTYVKSSS